MSNNVLECRVRVRCPYDVNWLDVCNNKSFIRDETNTKWIPVVPGLTHVQIPEYMRKWILVTCQFDPEFDDPCETPTLPGGDCTGQPNDPTAGSGDGVGSGGARYSMDTGYPVGYDLPDSGIAGFNLFTSKDSHSGFVLYRPVLGTSHSYQKGIAGGSGRGTWNNPLVEYDSLYVGKSKITESIVDISGITGCMPIYYKNEDGCCLAIDVYLDGKRIATTCGPTCLGGVLHACIPPHISDKMLVRFTKLEESSDCGSEIKIGPENEGGDDIITHPDDPENGGGTINPGGDGKDEDGDGEHDGGLDEDKLPDIGTPLFPYTCGSTVRPDWETDNNVVSYTHFMGNVYGQLTLCMSHVGNFTIDVLYEGNIIASSRTGFEGNCMEFTYRPINSQHLTVRITSKDPLPNGWEYSLYCVRDDEDDEDGSKVHPLSCNFTIESTGSPLHKHWFDMHFEDRDDAFDNSMLVIECNPMDDPDTVFSVYDNDGVLIDSYSGNKIGNIQFPRMLDTHGDSRDKFYVYVESNIASSWEYYVNCPIELLRIEVEGEIVPWTPSSARP